MSRIRMSYAIVSVSLAAAILSQPIIAAQSIYNTNRMLEHLGNECQGVPGCETVESLPMVINSDGTQVLAVNCPSSHPFVWHWDTRQHEHIYAKLVGRTRTGLTLSVSNTADAPGKVQIFIGCSAQPFSFAGTGFMQSTTGVPTGQNVGKKNKGNKENEGHEPRNQQ